MAFSQRRPMQPRSETWLVAAGNQSFASTNGIYDTAGDTGVADGQLAVISWDESASHLDKGDFLTATNDIAGTGPNPVSEISKIKIVQGTAYSADYSGLNANSAVYNEGALVMSQVLDGTQKFEFVGVASTTGRRSAFVASNVTSGTTSFNPGDDTVYTMSVSFHSSRRDKIFGTRSTDAAHLSVLTPTFADLGLATKAAKVDWLIQNLVFEAALRSRSVNLSTNPTIGSKPFIAFAIDIDGGGTGTAISAVTAGTPFNFITRNGTTYSYTPDAEFVATLTQAVANSDLLVTSEIGVVDLSTAGSQAHDMILIVALDEIVGGVVRDREPRQKVRLRVGMNEELYQNGNITYLVEASTYLDAQGKGRDLAIAYETRAKKMVWSEQDHGHTNTFIQSADFIVESASYNVFDIVSNRDMLDYSGQIVQRPDITRILVPATAGVGEANTVTDLNAILQPWLDSVGYENKNTDAAGSNLFV